MVYSIQSCPALTIGLDGIYLNHSCTGRKVMKNDVEKTDKEAAVEAVTLPITGMTCWRCAKRLEKALRAGLYRE